MALLEVYNLHTSYGAIKALRGLNFKVEQGQVVSLIGANGAGKSTTLNTISGLLQPQQYPELLEILSIQIGYKTFLLLFFFLAVEWQGREQPYAIARLGLQWSRTPRYIMYYLIILAICWSGGTEQEFIYFQF